jgi:hypothetical protein
MLNRLEQREHQEQEEEGRVLKEQEKKYCDTREKKIKEQEMEQEEEEGMEEEEQEQKEQESCSRMSSIPLLLILSKVCISYFTVLQKLHTVFFRFCIHRF